MTKQEILIKNVIRWYLIYKGYIADNGLDDDSGVVTVEDLFGFIEDIDQEDQESYYESGKIRGL